MMGDCTSGSGDTGCVDSVCVNMSVAMVFVVVVVVVVVVILGISEVGVVVGVVMGVVADADAMKGLGPFDCVINRRGLGLGLGLGLWLGLTSMLLIAPGLRGGEKW